MPASGLRFPDSLHQSTVSCVIFAPPNDSIVMVIELPQDATPEDVRAALEKIAAAKAAERTRKRLATFGAWKSAPVDGLAFQREVRNEWN